MSDIVSGSQIQGSGSYLGGVASAGIPVASGLSIQQKKERAEFIRKYIILTAPPIGFLEQYAKEAATVWDKYLKV